MPITKETAADAASDNKAAAASVLQEGIRAAQAGDRSAARVALLRATDLDPRSENAWLWLASISEYPEELLVFLTNVLDINPENARALEWSAATRALLSKTFVQRGIDAVQESRPDFASECFSKALEHDPHNGMAWLWMASLSDSNEGKLTYLEKVLSIDPENAEAKTAIEAVRKDIREKWHADAKAAAVAGRPDEAIAFLDSLLAEFPEYEDGWFLKSHVVDNFSEKIACFDRVLAINPQNTAAAAGRESLLAIVGTVPVSADERPEPESSERSLSAEKASFVDDIAIDKNPTQELELPETLASSSFAEPADPQPNEIAAAEAQAPLEHYEAPTPQIPQESNSPFTEKVEVSAETVDIPEQHAAEPEPDHGFVFQPSGDGEPVVPESDSVDVSAFFEYSDTYAPAPDDEAVSENNELPAYSFENGTAESLNGNGSYENRSGGVDYAFVPDAFADNGHTNGESSIETAEASDEPMFAGIPMPAAAFELPTETRARTGFETRIVAREDGRRKSSEMVPCAFCNTDNESQAIVCQACMAVLTLSDLEMLLGNQNADKLILRQAVEIMERERTARQLSEGELTMLGIGHLNLRNLQYGFAYLQEASQLNPNNVVLSSQVNALHIRLEEIKKQDEAHERMPKNKTILVVDDSPTVRKLIAGKLEKCGHDVFCSNDGVEAMERLQDLVPDLILLDITMPRMDGYQVCKLIRSNDATKDVPVVMISGKDGFFDKVRGRMAGTSGYITKPFGPETLMKAVEAYLKGEVQETFE